MPSERYAPSMRSRKQSAPVIFGITLAIATLVACGESGGLQVADAVQSGATSEEAANVGSLDGQTGSANGSTGDRCVSLGENFKYDELSASASALYELDAKQLENLIESTPAGGHDRFLNALCAATIAGYGPDNPISTMVPESLATSEENRLQSINGAYKNCIDILADKSPSETFEPDPPGVIDLSILKIANQYICPQIAFPKFPS